jgi:RNA recognition motif-containing protein
LKDLNGKKLGKTEVKVGTLILRSERPKTTLRNKLYIKNFPQIFDQQQVEDFIKKSFGEFGKIESTGIKRDDRVGRYYAFVAFNEGDEARNAIQALNEHQFAEGDKLFIDYVQPKDQRRKMLVQKHLKYKNETNLYIRSVKPDVTEDQLRSAFAKYGTITSICLKK